MTPTDRASRTEDPPWKESGDGILEAFCRTGEDLLLTIDLRFDSTDFTFEICRGEPPLPSDRFRVEARGNVVQLTLQHANRDDAGHYALMAKRSTSHENESERLFTRRIHMSIDEPSFTEDGDPPLFVRRLTDLTVKVGTRTRFLVEIKSANDPKVTWHRNDEPIKAGPRFSILQEGRNFFCIDVAPVTVDDQGHWTCMAENRSGRSSCTSHLNVLVPKAYKRPEFISELRALLTETGTVSLECKVVGVPTPVLNWYKDNKAIKAGDVFALTANPEDPTSLGTYTCEAVNCMGTAYSSSRVHFVGKGSREGSLKPADTLITGDPPIFKKILRDDCCRINDVLSLSCQVQVPPWPKDITWYNKEGRVKSDERYKIMADGLGGYSVHVNPVEAVDEGEWKCVATSAENVKQFTTCYVAMSIPKNFKKPRFMESLRAVLTEEGLVSFECKVVGFPTPVLKWFKDGQELRPGDVYQLTGTNSLGSYCCIAKNCMGEAKSTAELTVEDIQSQLNEEERLQLLTTNQPPKFIKGLRSSEARITESFRFSVQVSVMPEPNLAWFRDDHPVDNEEERYRIERETLGICHLEIQKLEFCDQAEWKCIASNDFGHSITSCFLKLIIPKHYKKPKFLENLRALLSEGGAVNLECKVIGVPQPILKWYKDGHELKPGDIHRIISGQDGTCCLGTYTCEASNCMGTVSSSASLLGFEDRTSSTRGIETSLPIMSQVDQERELARNLSLSTIHEERTSQLLESALTDHSATVDDRGEISFSFDGKEVSVSLYETPDLTEEEALQIVEMYADQLSEHVSEHNVVELPPMRFVKETSTSGNLLMEAVVIDVSPDYFVSIEDDSRTEADVEDISTIDNASLSSPLTESISDSKLPSRPPRRKSGSVTSKLLDQQESESYHSAKEPVSLLEHKKIDTEFDMEVESEAFADALSSARTKPESIAPEVKSQRELRKRSISDVSSLETADSIDSSLGLGTEKRIKTKKKRRLSEKRSSEDSLSETQEEKKQKETLEADVSVEEDDSKSAKSNKERFMNLLRHIIEPVLIIREALIDSDITLENENLINAFVTDNILSPIQNLCEVIAAIETKALQSSGERSLAQNVRISILETIGGPTEELLRGLELMKLPENDENIQTKLSILESLVDPIDEILFNLAKLEFELTGHNGSETPVILERTVRTTERLGCSLKEANNEAETAMITALKKIHQTLTSYLENIVLNQYGGWTENIDAVLVESLARPLEDLERSSKFIFESNNARKTSKVFEKMSDAFNEILSRLDALVVALEGYESDHRTNFVVNLKTSLVAAAEELTRTRDFKQESFDEVHILPEMILDSLIDAQSSVNSILFEVEKIDQGKEVSALKTSELALSLVELRDAVSYAVHKTTTLKKDETISALINLKEPLNDLQLALSIERIPQELAVIESILLPLIPIKKVLISVLQNLESSGTDVEVLNVIQPILKIVEELQQQIPLVLHSFEHAIIEKENITPMMSSAILKTIHNLQFASELSTVHFELATILDKCETVIGNVENLPVFVEVSNLRQNIGNAAIEIDKVSSSSKPNIENYIEELSNLKEPLLKLQNILLTEDTSLKEQKIIVELLEPLERLKAVSVNFSNEVIHSEEINSIINLIDDIQKDIALQTKLICKDALEEELNIQSESYSSIDFERKTLFEEAKVKTISEQEDVLEQSLVTDQVTNQNVKNLEETPQVLTAPSEILDEAVVEIQRHRDKISDKQVIYPKEEFAFVISQSLEEIQAEISEILEEFEQESVTVQHPVSRLAEALENLRRTIIVVNASVSRIAHEITDVISESSLAESHESAERISMSLKELLHPILEVREALAQTQDHKAPEVLLLNRLDQPIRAIEFNVLQLALEAHSHTVESDGTSSRASLDAMARVLEDIESQIPLALDEVNLRQEIMSILRNVTKPLDIINDRMQEILTDSSNENSLETDMANILVKPVNELKVSLNDLFHQMEFTEHLDDKNKYMIFLLKHLIEPLVELQSSLSVIRNSRRTSVTETELQDEKKNVLLRAIEEVKIGIHKIHDQINIPTETTTLEKKIIFSIEALDSALSLVQNQIREVNYIQRRSCLETLPQRTVEPMQKLAEKIAVIEQEMEKKALKFILEPLEALWKQVQLAQMQFLQLSDQPSDEEAIIEGFLYPTKHLLNALELAKLDENFITSENTVNLLQDLEKCTTSFGSRLFLLRSDLISEGADEKDSIVETLTAVLVPLDNIKKLVTEMSLMSKESSFKFDDSSSPLYTDESSKEAKKIIPSENEKSEKEYGNDEKKLEISEKLPTVLTTVETIVDEFIEVSKRETESLTTLQFASAEPITDEVTNRLNEAIVSQNVEVTDSVEDRVSERRDSITALWYIIQEPLNNLQQSISTIFETPSVIDEISLAEANNSTEHTVLDSLSNLQTSIAVMQQIVDTGSEKLTVYSCQEKSLPALQNLAISLEKLGEKLPSLASQNMLIAENVDNLEELSENSSVARALKTLITPLHELKERLSLLVEEQVPFEQNLTELELKQPGASASEVNEGFSRDQKYTVITTETKEYIDSNIEKKDELIMEVVEEENQELEQSEKNKDNILKKEQGEKELSNDEKNNCLKMEQDHSETIGREDLERKESDEKTTEQQEESIKMKELEEQKQSQQVLNLRQMEDEEENWEKLKGVDKLEQVEEHENRQIKSEDSLHKKEAEQLKEDIKKEDLIQKEIADQEEKTKTEDEPEDEEEAKELHKQIEGKELKEKRTAEFSEMEIAEQTQKEKDEAKQQRNSRIRKELEETEVLQRAKEEHELKEEAEEHQKEKDEKELNEKKEAEQLQTEKEKQKLEKKEKAERIRAEEEAKEAGPQQKEEEEYELKDEEELGRKKDEKKEKEQKEIEVTKRQQGEKDDKELKEREEKEIEDRTQAELLQKENVEKEESEQQRKEKEEQELNKSKSELIQKKKEEEEEAELQQKESEKTEEAERSQIEKKEKQEAERQKKEKEEKEEAERQREEKEENEMQKKEVERFQREKEEQKEAERQQKQKEESELKKKEAERLHKEKKEAERLQKEKEEKEDAERQEKQKEENELKKEDRLQKEKEETERLQKEKEKKEEAERQMKQEEENELKKKEEDRLQKEKEKAERLQKEKEEKEEAKRQQKQKEEKEEAERLQKEKEEAELKKKEKEQEAEAERLQKEKEEKEEADRLQKEKEENELKKKEAERLQKEQEVAERLQKGQEEAEKLQKEQEEAERQLKQKEEDELQIKEADRLQKEKEEKEEAKRKQKEKEENELKKQEEEKLQKEKEEAVRLQKEKEEREKAERQLKQKEEDELQKKEADLLQKEEEEKEEAKRKQKEKEENELKKKEAERLQKEKEEADRLKKEKEQKEEIVRLQKEKEEKEKAERLQKQKEENELKKKEDERLRKEKEEAERLQKEKEEKEEAERQQKQKEENELKKKEAERLQKEKEEANRQQKQKEENELKKKDEDRLQKEKEEAERLQKEEKEEAERQQKQKEENELKKKEAERLQKEKEEAERQQKQKEENELKKKEEDRLQKEKEEAERLQKEKEEKEEAERQQKQKEEDDLKKKEAQRLQKEKEEAERQKKEKEETAEAERLQKEKEEKEEAERQQKQKETELKKKEAERLQKEKEEAERQKKEKEEIAEAERLQKEKEEKEEAERQQKQKEEDELKKKEAERLQKEEEEAERQKKEKEEIAETERLQKEKEEKEEAERQQKQKEEDELKKKEADRLQKEKEKAEQKKKKKEQEAEAERLQKEKEEKEEAERLQKEKEESELKQKEKEEAERLQKENEEKERAERLQKENAEKELKEKEEKELKKKEAERLQNEKEEKESKEKEEAVRQLKEKEEKESLENIEAERNRQKEKEDKELKVKKEAEQLKEKEEKLLREKEEIKRQQKEKEVKEEAESQQKEIEEEKLTVKEEAHQQSKAKEEKELQKKEDLQRPEKVKEESEQQKKVNADVDLKEKEEAELQQKDKGEEGLKKIEQTKLQDKAEILKLDESVPSKKEKEKNEESKRSSKKKDAAEQSKIDEVDSNKKEEQQKKSRRKSVKSEESSSKRKGSNGSIKNQSNVSRKSSKGDDELAISRNASIKSSDETQVSIHSQKDNVDSRIDISVNKETQGNKINDSNFEVKNYISDQKSSVDIGKSTPKFTDVVGTDTSRMKSSEYTDSMSHKISSKNDYIKKRPVEMEKYENFDRVNGFSSRESETEKDNFKTSSKDYSYFQSSRNVSQREISKLDGSFSREKSNFNSQYSKIKKDSLYNKNTMFDSESTLKFDPHKTFSSNLSRLSLIDSVPELNRQRSERKLHFLSRSRDDLFRRDYELRSSYPSLYSGASIPDLTSITKNSRCFDLGRKYDNYSSSSLNLETEIKRQRFVRSYDNFKTAFQHPTYTPKSFYTSDYSLSVSDSLALSRSRRRFESRNSHIIYQDNSESRSFKNRVLERGKCPTFCTRLTNCTVAEGSHIRLMCTIIGQPEPQVYWTKNGDRVRSGGRELTKYENGMATLEITAAELEDSGYYTCVSKNSYGQATTEATVRVYSVYQTSPLGPTFTPFMSDKYKRSDRELILETRVRGNPTPSISWLKDDRLLQGDRYRQSLAGHGICSLRISEPDLSDSGLYVCKATSDKSINQIRHMVHFDGLDNVKSRKRRDYDFDKRLYSSGVSMEKLPRISSTLADHKVPAGGTIALQVEIKDTLAPKVSWFRDHGERRELVTSPKIRTFSESGIHTLIVPEVTESEAGTYICRVSNAYGHVDTSATVEVVPLSKFDDLGKPAMFVSRPAEKLIYAMAGEPVSVSFRISGTPRPRVVWMKGLKDITDGPRSHKEMIDDYVRLTLNRINPDDEGTFCILVKNCYGCDRSFFTLKVRQRARSLTPTSERLSFADRLSDIHIKEQESYLRNVPGPISTEPVVVDGGRNWLSLVWGKADQRGPAPVIAYRVDAWQLGGDGGARWVELGITPINSFDAFNLRPGGEYKFRVTPRNRYGWGESVTMNGSATVCDDVDIPEFAKILPGQLKALVGSTVNLECTVRSDSKFDVKWLRETTEIDSNFDSRYMIKNEKSKCSLVLKNINEDDTGRYICEVTNKAGKVSSYGRILVVDDPKILNADARLKKRFSDGLTDDGPPNFTMRLRDRRVQTSYPVRLTCQVFGFPEPEVTWFKDDEKVVETATRSIYNDDSHFHTLEIARSTLEDAGRYTACAKNPNGSLSCHCVLVVDKGIRAYIAPEFLYGLDVAYAVKVGGELRLMAQIEAYPSVGIVWHRDGIRLRPRRRAIMSLSHDGTAELVLHQVTVRDAGVYTCTATNEVGRAETTTRVSVVGFDSGRETLVDDGSPQVVVNPPDIDVPYSKVPLFVTKPLSSEAQEGDTIVIKCEVVGDPKPEVVWLRDFLKPEYYRDAPHFRRIGAGPQYSLEIPHAKLDYTGTYSVLARNEHGEAKAVISLQIYAKGQGKSDNMDQRSIRQGNILSVPTITKELKDIRCCDGDAVTLECKVYAPSEPPNIRWEKSGKTLPVDDDFSVKFDGQTAKLIIRHVYPEDEGEYTCIATNELGKAYTSACLVVDVPEGKENILSQPRLTRPQGLLSANSTPRSTPRSTPVRSLSPNVQQRGRELKALNLPRRIEGELPRSRRPKVTPPKFYTIPHNRVAEEGETVRFQCAVAGNPAPWCVWDKNGVTVTSSARITVKDRDDVRILEIAEVTPEDAGLYRVTLENDYGRTEATARLEVINRNTLNPRPIRTRSASPRTYPTISKSLLGTTTRLNGRLQLQCDLRGSPAPSTTWYRNGSRIERSSRVKKSFTNGRALLEISNVQYSDAGEYVCEAKNFLGTSKSSCKVVVLDPKDRSLKDREAPKFVESLPSESVVMEGHSYELQGRISGSPPFRVTWLKDGHEVIDSDYYRHIVYEDGGIALRFLNVHPLDAGDYTCVVRNDFGEATSRGLFVIQDYRNSTPNSKLCFVKKPVPVFVEKGETACFCARIQSDRSVDVDWKINGKSVREDYRCKIERDGSGTSILRIPYVSHRDCGEVRCIASINRGPTISSSTQLRLKPSSPSKHRDNWFNRLEPRSRSLPRLKESRKPNGLPSMHSLQVASEKRASSFSRLTTEDESVVDKPRRKRKSIEKIPSELLDSVEITIEAVEKVHLEIQPIEKVHVPIGFDEIDKSIVEILTQENIIKPILVDHSPIKDQLVSIKRISSFKNLCPLNNNNNNNNSDDEHKVDRKRTSKRRVDNGKKETPAQVIKPPDDVITLRGSTIRLEAEYQGYPEPTVKWMRAGRELVGEENKTCIENAGGRSWLTLYGITADQAGKYAVAVENALGTDCQFASVAVEGPPEPPCDPPSVRPLQRRGSSAAGASVTWCSPAYDGGCALTGYTVECRRVGETQWNVLAENCHSLSYEANSLRPRASYLFRVRALNIHGAGEPSPESRPCRIPFLDMDDAEDKLKVEEDQANMEDDGEDFSAEKIVTPEEGSLFKERYALHEELGKGRYGVVRRVVEKKSGKSYAAKFVRTVKSSDRQQVREEMKIMNLLRHPKLLRLAAAFESPKEIVMVTEYISGGELFERVVADDFTLTEKDSILFMRQICEGVRYMHENDIVHLDLKPENIMCHTRTSHRIKLIDFGLAQILSPTQPIRVLFGTPEFIPPEIINYEPIGTESDMWSVGVICYVLLTGLSPFMGDNDAETFANIVRADYDFEDEAFDAISADAKDFISNLLQKKKELRMSAEQCLDHSWLAQHTENMSQVALPTDKLKKFIVRRKWQKTGNALRALGRMAMLSANRRSPSLSPTSTRSLSEVTRSESLDSEYRYDSLDSSKEEPEEQNKISSKEKNTNGVLEKDVCEESNLEESFETPIESDFEEPIKLEEQETEFQDAEQLDSLELVEHQDVIDTIQEEEEPQNVEEEKSVNSEESLEESKVEEVGEIDNGVDDVVHEIKADAIKHVHYDVSPEEDDQTDEAVSPAKEDCSKIIDKSSLSLDLEEFRVDNGMEKNGNLSYEPVYHQEIKKSTDLKASKDLAFDQDTPRRSFRTFNAQFGANPNENSRLVEGSSLIRGRFMPTGNVSRTAMLFEKLETEAHSNGKPHNQNNSTIKSYPKDAPAASNGRNGSSGVKSRSERIQRAFAFWNK